MRDEPYRDPVGRLDPCWAVGVTEDPKRTGRNGSRAVVERSPQRVSSGALWLSRYSIALLRSDDPDVRSLGVERVARGR